MRGSCDHSLRFDSEPDQGVVDIRMGSSSHWGGRRYDMHVLILSGGELPVDVLDGVKKFVYEFDQEE